MESDPPSTTPRNAEINPPIIHFALGPQPGLITCPSCREQIRTEVRLENTMKTHLIAILLCLLCCPCVFIPYYCTDDCKGKNHYCPRCKTFLGSYNN